MAIISSQNDTRIKRTIQIDPDLNEKLRELSDAGHGSVNKLINRALKSQIKDVSLFAAMVDILHQVAADTAANRQAIDVVLPAMIKEMAELKVVLQVQAEQRSSIEVNMASINENVAVMTKLAKLILDKHQR